MALFVSESPKLGAGTLEAELSGAAGTPAGNPVLNYYKPTTREVVSYDFDGVRNAGQLSCWLFRAPWACQVVQVSVVTEVSATATATIQLYKLPFASQPAAPNGTGAVQLLSAAQSLSSATLTAQTVVLPTLTTTASQLVLASGDLIGFVISAAITAVLGGLLQVEIVQLG